jgi:modulator of FtsH protease HflC
MINRILATFGLLIIGIWLSTFTVSETEKVIKLRFGEIIGSDYEPGLHVKLPLADTIRRFDSRILTLDSSPEQFLTAEKKNVIVDSFVKWRIDQAPEFYTAVSGDPEQANIRLDQIVKDAFRSEFGKREIKQLVSSDRGAIREALITNVSPYAAKLGVAIVDVQIERIDLPSEVSNSVYQRMEAERERVARDFRSQGSEAAERIRADADKQREIILANARRDAEILRGEGDAKAADIFADAYGQDSDFYSFYRSLLAYKQSLGKPGNVLVLDPNSEFFKYFKSQKN